jgi:hypothetical protein
MIKIGSRKELANMGTAELTAKIESLSAEDYNMVTMIVNRLAEKSKADELPILSETQLIEELSESIRKSDAGATKSAQQISMSMREKYAV